MGVNEPSGDLPNEALLKWLSTRSPDELALLRDVEIKMRMAITSSAEDLSARKRELLTRQVHAHPGITRMLLFDEASKLMQVEAVLFMIK